MTFVADLTGQRFSRLLVLSQAPRERSDGKRVRVRWICQCDCGAQTAVLAYLLREGGTGSCGCLKADGNGTHGMMKSPIWSVWRNMKTRCTNQASNTYPNYGGRGIKVCYRWMSFIAFFGDVSADYRPGLQLDRIDNDGDYEPGNVRWATRKQNLRHTRQSRYLECNGERITIAEAAEKTGISHQTITTRLNAGRTEATGLFSPPRRHAP